MLLRNKLFGQKLIGISGTVYFESYNAVTRSFSEKDIIDFCFHFEELNITLKGNSTGDGILVLEGNYLNDVDMSEHGYLKVLSLIETFELNSYIGLKVSNIEDVNLNTNQVGIAMRFSTQKKLIIIF